MLEIVLQVISTVVFPLVGWLLIYVRSINVKIENLAKEVRVRPHRTEVRQLIEDLGKPTEIVQKELKEDIRRLEEKIDRLLAKSE